MTLSDRQIAHFWAKVDTSGDCWMWTAGLDAGGYGAFWADNRMLKSHRVAYYLSTGKAPEKHVLHSCDNPKCVNPAHLREGTIQDNKEDKLERGRQCQGEAVHTNKLTADEVLAIRTFQAYYTVQELASLFRVSRRNIAKILAEKSWKSLL